MTVKGMHVPTPPHGQFPPRLRRCKGLRLGSRAPYAPRSRPREWWRRLESGGGQGRAGELPGGGGGGQRVSSNVVGEERQNLGVVYYAA
ncbi:hypothetical protein E4U54_004535, partial [Claviceps lovelessii]